MTRSYWLESERIGFSRWTVADLDLALQLWGNPEVTRLISRTGRFTEQEVRQRLVQEVHNGEEHGLQYWPLFLKASSAFIGCCGLRPYEGEERSAELGAHLLPAAWGQGLAREASLAVIAYAFGPLGLNSLVAGHHPQNAASQRTLLGLGFVPRGEVYYPPTGLYHPSYRLTRPAVETRQQEV